MKNKKILIIIGVVVIVLALVAGLIIHFTRSENTSSSDIKTEGTQYDENIRISKDGMYFNIDKDNEVATLYTYEPTEKGLQDVIVPDTVDGLKVTKIASNAFADEEIKSITIGKNVTDIGNYAFQWCPFTKIVIPDKVVSLGTGAFLECEKLKSVTIPETVTTLGEDIFQGCSDELVIITQKDSAAAKYAKDKGMTIQYMD